MIGSSTPIIVARGLSIRVGPANLRIAGLGWHHLRVEHDRCAPRITELLDREPMIRYRLYLFEQLMPPRIVLFACEGRDDRPILNLDFSRAPYEPVDQEEIERRREQIAYRVGVVSRIDANFATLCRRNAVFLDRQPRHRDQRKREQFLARRRGHLDRDVPGMLEFAIFRLFTHRSSLTLRFPS